MFSLPLMRFIVPLVGAAAVVALGAYTYFAVKQARYMHTGPVVINVRGEGEVFARPDVATFNFSVIAEGEDAVSAQNESAERVNEIMSYLETSGIEETDIKTAYYNLNPRYEYTESVCTNRGYCPPGERVLLGYEVNQTIEVKVRETDRAGEFITGVGERGATNVSGLQFTIDDESTLMSEAREAAIADAQEKAERLASELGVRIVRMAGFYEEQGGYPMYYGRGDDAMMEQAVINKATEPSIPTGENTVMSWVNISYEVR